MTAAVHEFSRFKALAFGLCVFVLASLLGTAAGSAADNPNGIVSGSRLSGDNTYAQVQITSSPFKYEGGTLTLTGNINGELLTTTSHSRNLTFEVDSDASDATLVLQKGNFRANLRLGGNANTSTLVVGSGATSNRPTVTITGSLMGSNNGFSHVRTNGANLVINGGVGESNYIGRLSALNGNITMTQSSGQHQVGTVSVASGMQVFSQTRLTIVDDLDLQENAQLRSVSEIHIDGKFGQQGNVMHAGSLLWSGSSIQFYNNQLSDHTNERGIVNAAGIIHADLDIGSNGTAEIADITMAGSGAAMGSSAPLRIEAGRSISLGTIRATSVSAGGNIVAGTNNPSGTPLPVAGSGLTPARTITANTISAGGTVAAGEVTDFTDTPGSGVAAGRLLVVKGNGSTGNFTLNRGTFRLTSTGAIGNAEYAADGSIVAHSEASYVGGDMNVTNSGASSFTTLGVGGGARISGGSLSGGALGAASVTLHNGVDASIDSVTVRTGNMQIGAAADTAAATTVGIANLRLNRHDLLVGAGDGEAFGAVGNFVTAAGAGNLTDGAITVSHNGRLALGTSSTGSLKAITAKVGMAPSSAVLGVFSPVVLGSSLAVDHAASVGAARALSREAAGPSRAAAGPVSFSGNSLLVIDGAKTGVNYANPAVPTRALPATLPGALSAAAPMQASVAPGAKIYIDHVTPGHTYVALGRNITTNYADATGWSGANLISSNPLLELTRLGNGMEGQFSVTEKAPHTKSVGVASGVPRLARAASESMESAIYSRIKLGQEDLYRHSFALWALPLYESIDHFGLDGGTASYGFRGGIGGLAVGCDYTWENTLRAGLSLNMGAGYVKSTGDMASTQNSATFWGVGAYGVWKPGVLSFDAEVDVTSVYNKVRQDLPAGLDGAELKADIPAWSLGMSLRAEYEIDTRYVNLRPHLGVRYLHMVSEPFDATLHGEDVLHGNRTHQNVWTMPFGLVLTKPFRLENGWEITPLVNLKAIPALGDTYAKTSVRYTGAHKAQEFDSQVMDAITWGGRAGVELRAGDLSAGLNYIGQFGEHTANQGLFGVLRYEF